MIVTRFIQVANLYQKQITDEIELVSKIEEVLKNDIEVNMTSKLDSTGLQKATVYYNFASYSILGYKFHFILF